VKSNDISLTKLLLNNFAAVNATDGKFETPLHYAAKIGNIEMIKLLIKYGADIQAKDCYGRTSIYLAQERGFRDVIKLLENNCDESGKSRKLKRIDPNSLLSNLSGVKAKKISKKIASLDFNELVKTGNILDILDFIDLGANVNSRDVNSQTPLHHAVLMGRIDIVAILIESGADINSLDFYGDSPLHLAVFKNPLSKGHIDIIKLLIEKGADVKIKNGNNIAPIDIINTIDIKELLIDKKLNESENDKSQASIISKVLNWFSFNF
jgi:ankyrin repeat protein